MGSGCSPSTFSSSFTLIGMGRDFICSLLVFTGGTGLRVPLVFVSVPLALSGFGGRRAVTYYLDTALAATLKGHFLSRENNLASLYFGQSLHSKNYTETSLWDKGLGEKCSRQNTRTGQVSVKSTLIISSPFRSLIL